MAWCGFPLVGRRVLQGGTSSLSLGVLPVVAWYFAVSLHGAGVLLWSVSALSSVGVSSVMVWMWSSSVVESSRLSFVLCVCPSVV